MAFVHTESIPVLRRKIGVTSYAPTVRLTPADSGLDEGTKRVEVTVLNATIPLKMRNVVTGSITLLEDGVLRTATIPGGWYVLGDVTGVVPPPANDLAVAVMTALGPRYRCVLDTVDPARRGHVYLEYLGGLVGTPQIVATTLGRRLGIPPTQLPLSLPVGVQVYTADSYDLAATQYISVYSSLAAGSGCIENYVAGELLAGARVAQEATRSEDLLTRIPVRSGFDSTIVYEPSNDHVTTTIGALRAFDVTLLDDEDNPIDTAGLAWSLLLQVSATV